MRPDDTEILAVVWRTAQILLPEEKVTRLTFVALLLGVASCGHDSPTAPRGCVSIAGSYSLHFANSCGASVSGGAVVAQEGCSVSAAIPTIGQLEGTLDGNSLTFTLSPVSCGSTVTTGTATIGANGSISGTFTGHSPGGSGCCPAGTVTGSFTAVRA